MDGYLMTKLDPMALLNAPDADIKQQFEDFIRSEKENGLVDIKFAIAPSQDSTVVDAMRQLMVVHSMREAGLLPAFND